MESVNRIEILGNVGNIRIQEAGESRAIHLSVVTNRVARNKNGENYVEATWHYVEAWENQANIADFSTITKGCWVRVIGRITNNKYTGSEAVALDSDSFTVDHLTVTFATEQAAITAYNLAGIPVAQARNAAAITLPASGIFIVVTPAGARRIHLQ